MYLNEENPDKNIFFQKKKIVELRKATNKTNKKRQVNKILEHRT